MGTADQVASTVVGQDDRSSERRLGEYGEGEKEESWCFEFDQLGDRRVGDEEGRRVVVMGVKTVVADKETCLLSERPARPLEDGGRGRRGEGCTVVKAGDRD